MKTRATTIWSCLAALLLIGLSISPVRSGDGETTGPSGKTAAPVQQEVAPSPPAGESDGRRTTAAAREQARLMHDIYAATLEVMHDRYFHGDRAIVPALAMEDVFTNLEKSTRSQARWISVNTKAMNIDHEPRSEFEKEAAAALAAGKREFEAVEGGFYRRAAVIPLAAGCVSCHIGFFKEAPKSPRLAGLILSMPVLPDGAETAPAPSSSPAGAPSASR